MKNMTRREFNEQWGKQFTLFLGEKKEHSECKPEGFFGNWGFHTMAEREFTKLKKIKIID